MASTVELATLLASILAALRRNGRMPTDDELAADLLVRGIADSRTGQQIRMHVRGLHTITAAEVGQWIELLDAYPRTKLFIQNRGTGASPNVGIVFMADQQRPGATEGLRLLADGHFLDEQGCHQGKVFVNGNTANIVIAIVEWGPSERTT